MDIESILITTKVVRPGMTVREVFLECGRAQVQALPFVDAHGRLAGRITLKNVLRVSCLPDYMVELAPLLGSRLSCVTNAEAKAREILCNPVEPYVQSMHETVPSSVPLIKVLALMEQHDTSYIFVVDDGTYRGLITIQGIAASMCELRECPL